MSHITHGFLRFSKKSYKRLGMKIHLLGVMEGPQPRNFGAQDSCAGFHRRFRVPVSARELKPFGRICQDLHGSRKTLSAGILESFSCSECFERYESGFRGKGYAWCLVMSLCIPASCCKTMRVQADLRQFESQDLLLICL